MARSAYLDSNRHSPRPRTHPVQATNQPMTITIIRQIEITVEVHLKPGTPATHVEPADYSDIEIIEAHADGESIELTEAEIEEVREIALDY